MTDDDVKQELLKRVPAETSKSYARRIREGWFEKYAPEEKSGLDIGCQYDPLNETFRRWDFVFGDGDAHHLKGIADGSMHTVYASHVLEHMVDPWLAVKNWWRVLSPGGHLIVLVPHRELYEKKSQPPSSWNFDHKWFFLPNRSEPPKVLSLKGVMDEAIPEGKIVLFRVLDEGHDYSIPSDKHSNGEFSIELILRK